MSEDSARLQNLFEHALGLDDAAREVWLAQLQNAQPELATRIQRMLAHDAQCADPFAHAINSLKQSLDFDAHALLGQEFGSFKLLRLIGQGGMGAVFLAERSAAQFRQLVAVKLMRGRWLEPTSLARFAEERRILAHLRHPNIATLIDAGASDDGRPYLVMEFIEGMPLLEFCDAQRLDVPARLHLVRGLLAALDHAHRALVVHRDLKPGNVLVTPDGIPKLLDFGIARLLDTDTSSRRTATRAFTPEYASPEQLAGEPVGTGSDIYSLGLVLYELCVGVLPWEGGARPGTGGTSATPNARLHQLDSHLRHELAARRGSDVRHLLRNLRGDLGRVFARCLAVDPAARYPSVHALDTDLAAVLAHKPPVGVQVPMGERALAFARRHIWPLALASLILLAGGALLVQSLRSEQRLAAQRDRAVAAAKHAQIEAAKANQITGFVQTMLADIGPNRAHGMDRSLMRLVLDNAAKRADRELSGQPAVRMVIERTIAVSYNSIGESGLALAHFSAALDAAAKADAPAAQCVELMTAKAGVLADLGQSQPAMKLIGKALKTAAALPVTARARLYAQSTLARFNCNEGHFAQCRDGYNSALTLQRSAFGAQDKDTLESMLGLADAQSALANFDKARNLFQQVIAGYNTQFGPTNSRTLSAINGLAVNELKAKQFADAEALLSPAVKLAEKSFGQNHPLTLQLVSNLGSAIRQQPGRNAQARPYYQRVLQAFTTLYGPDDNRSVIAEVNFALLLRDSGDLADAEHHARTAVAHMDAAFGKHNVMRGIVLDYLATVLIRAHKFDEALRTLDRAWKIYASSNGFASNHPKVQEAVEHYVQLYSAWHKPKLAAQWRARLTTEKSAAGAAKP